MPYTRDGAKLKDTDESHCKEHSISNGLNDLIGR